MATKLAINGGKPVRPKRATWPQWPVHDTQDVKLLSEITRSNRWSYDGKYEWQFAKAFSKYQKSEFGLCCANGTIAMQLAMEALGIGAGDEVIVPGLTWQATAAAVLDVNAAPVLVDVEPDTWCLDVDKAAPAQSPRFTSHASAQCVSPIGGFAGWRRAQTCRASDTGAACSMP